MHKLSFRQKLLGLIGIFVISLLASNVSMFIALNQVKVNGPIYSSLKGNYDLLADILPPPEYLLESYLVSFQMSTASPGELPVLIEKSQHLAEVFENRYEYWIKNLPEGELKKLITDRLYPPGRAFLNLQAGEYFPALESGDSTSARTSLAELTRLYEQHRQGVDELVKATGIATMATEQNADGFIRLLTALLVGLVGACLALSLFFAVLIIRGVMRSLGADPSVALAVVQKVAAGDLTVAIELQGKDSSSLLYAIKGMVLSLSRVIHEIKTMVRALESAGTELSTISGQVSTSTESTSHRSSTVAAAGEQMSANMNSVSANMEQTTRNIASVATATEELTYTIGEVAGNSEKARTITADAVSKVKAVGLVMDNLGLAAREIGKVTEAISAISRQTNLLALNATIEAARAGQAGKGFAVVANEIKDLSRQTAQATEAISSRILAIQDSSLQAVGSIDQVVAVIHETNSIVAGIATAIEEQSVVTKDIAGNVSRTSLAIENSNRNVSQASQASRSIVNDMAAVNNAAGEIAAASAQVMASADDLARLAAKLRTEIEHFKLEQE